MRGSLISLEVRLRAHLRVVLGRLQLFGKGEWDGKVTVPVNDTGG